MDAEEVSQRPQVRPWVGLLFTDIEGSTALLGRAPEEYARALARHLDLLRKAAADQCGREFHEAGDGLMLAFDSVAQAARAALVMQQALRDETWPDEIGTLRVRMALHWAQAEFRDGQFRGSPIHRAARLLSGAHGGQILCSDAAAQALTGSDAGGRLVFLGTYRLRGFEQGERIYQWEDPHAPVEFPVLRAEHARWHNLPASGETFFGREDELAAVADLLRVESIERRVVCLTGPGGMGKTRLAVACGWHLLESYDHAVFFVAMAQSRNTEDISEGIMRALRLPVNETVSSEEVVVAHLKDFPVLLIVDNLEHLAAEVSGAIQRLMRRLPRARFLLTSRARLGLRDEVEVSLAPLPAPREGESFERVAGNASVRVFADRAKHARPEFALDAKNAEAVAGICRMMDGLPLALEIAAARLQVFTAEELRVNLEREMAGAKPVEPGLHASLDQVFSWSLNLMPPEIGAFLETLSVFRGGWTTEAAGQVTGVGEERLVRASLHYLLTCSLVRATETEDGMRFVMLEPIRQFAQARAVERENEVRGRFCQYFAKWAERVVEKKRVAGEEDALTLLDRERLNLFSALEWEPSNARRVKLALNLHKLASQMGWARTLRTFLLKHDPAGGEVAEPWQARVWHAVGVSDLIASDLDRARQAFEKALSLFLKYNELHPASLCRANLGNIAAGEERWDDAHQLYQETLEAARARADFSAAGVLLGNLAHVDWERGREEDAFRHHRESVEILRGAGDLGALGWELNTFADHLRKSGQLAEALAVVREALELQIRTRQEEGFADTLCTVGMMACSLEDWRAAAYFAAAVRKILSRAPGRLSRQGQADLAKMETSAALHLSSSERLRWQTAGSEAESSEWLDRLPQVFLAG